MSEKKKYRLGSGVDCKEEHTVTRVVGENEYVIVYHELNGDEYERALYDSAALAKGDDGKRQKHLAERIREKMLVSVAGEAYTDTLVRRMPVWLLADVNEFLNQYIQGFA